MRQDTDGANVWIVKDPARQKYFRFGQIEAWLMQRMDGSRSLQEICDELHDSAGVRATPAALDVLVRRLREIGLVERSLQERSALLIEQLRTQRRIRRESPNTLLRMRFSFGDPDAFMARFVAAAPFFWTRGFVIASLIAFTLYLIGLAVYWTPFVAASATLVDPARVSLPLLLLTYVMITVVSVIHEFGHGLTCKRFGGEVRELGAMLLYFMPAFYCNISDAWAFEKRSHRLWVTFAGGWIELWVAVIAAVVWFFTEPGTFINTFAAITAALAGALSVLMNYNPLLPFDGYYALVDWFGMPNLRGRSFGYLGALIRRHVLRMAVPTPPATAREQRIYVIFAVCAGLYSTLILGVVSWFVARLLIVHWGAWGVFVFTAVLFGLTAKPRAVVARAARAFRAEKLPGPRLRRVFAAGLGVVIIVAALAGAVPWVVRATATAVVEPEVRVWLRAHRAATLVDVRVREGDLVRSGDTIAVLRDPELELDRLRAQARLHEAQRRAAAAAARGRATDARTATLEAESWTARLRMIDTARGELVLRAPRDGLVATPRLEDRIGDRIVAGDSIVEIWSTGALRVRLEARPREAGMLTVGAPVRIRFAAHPGVTWTGRVEAVESAAERNLITAYASLGTSSEHPLRPGMIGRARVDLARTTIARALMHTARRTMRLDLLL